MRELDTTFKAYELTEQEVMASKFNELQCMYLQTELAVLAETKLNLTFTPNDPLTYTQEEASLTGKIHLLRALLNHTRVD